MEKELIRLFEAVQKAAEATGAEGGPEEDRCLDALNQLKQLGNVFVVSIIAGAATGGFLQMRQGLGAASRSAMFGGVLLALIEGAGIMLNKLMSNPQFLPPMEEQQQGVPPGYMN
ncbi:hypothetical protein LIER_09332 [Lithospermum erythrorhizon]|uniref:Uncharacterized protein n=1 Tax=Lithospermum erythrorhizon TaxID=34254 RepID=A0AAV3PFA4_LITER